MRRILATTGLVALLTFVIIPPDVKGKELPGGGQLEPRCPEYPTTYKSFCLRNPCQTVKCKPDNVCCPNYSSGCNYKCIPINQLKKQCPAYPANVACFAPPCSVNEPKCPKGKTCCDDYSTGCDHHCLT